MLRTTLRKSVGIYRNQNTSIGVRWYVEKKEQKKSESTSSPSSPSPAENASSLPPLHSDPHTATPKPKKLKFILVHIPILYFL